MSIKDPKQPSGCLLHNFLNFNIMQTYNGYTLDQIKKNFPANMPKIHKDLYLKNCIEIMQNEASGYNLDYNECLRNSNFNLIRFYLES